MKSTTAKKKSDPTPTASTTEEPKQPNRATRRARPVRTTQVLTAAHLSRTASMMPRSFETVTVKEETLAATQPKMLLFLNTMAKNDRLRAVLAARGYTPDEHQRGWNLLLRTSGYRAPNAPVLERSVQEAHEELDGWLDLNLGIFEAGLRHRHPDQFAIVFADPAPKRSDGVVLAGARLLERVAQLESEASGAAGRAAVATLEQRGFTRDERARLSDLVREARGAEGGLAAPTPGLSASDVYRFESRAWYEEWTAIARRLIKRRSDLILLGLAKRRNKGAAEEETEQDEEGDGEEAGPEGDADEEANDQE